MLTIGIAAAVLVGWWLTRPDEAAGEAPPRPPYVLPVTLATVRVTDVEPRVALTGTVRSRNRATLAFQIAGSITEFKFEEADAVTEGALLARLDDRDQRLVVAQREADLRLAQKELALLEAGSREEVIKRLESTLDAAQAEVDLAKLELDRGRLLLQSNDIPQAEMDRRDMTLRAAEGRRSASKAALLEAKKGTRAEDIEIAKAEVDIRSAALDLALRELEKTELVAPWSGVVVDRRGAAGDYVRAGDLVIELVDLENVEIQVEVPARYEAQVGGRPRVRLTIDEDPNFAIEAELSALIPSADRASRNYVGLVRLAADRDSKRRLKPGAFVRVDLELDVLKGALVVPKDAVRLTDSGTIVVRAARNPEAAPQMPDRVAELVAVRVLARDADGAAVEPLGGQLSAGDEVVVTGVDIAFPGVPLFAREEVAADPGEVETPGGDE